MNTQTTFRGFLKARYAFLKRRPELKYSFRAFSRLAGFGSPNYLHLVMVGKRVPSVAAIPKFAKGLLLNPAQTRIFTKLALAEIAAKNAPIRAFVDESSKVKSDVVAEAM